MKRYLAILLSVLLISCVEEKTLTIESQINLPTTGVDGSVYVKFTDELAKVIEEDLTEDNLVTRSAGLNMSLETLGITSIHRVFSHGGKYEARRRAAGLHRWYAVTYSPEVAQTKAIGDLAAIEGVEAVEPVRQIAIHDGISFNDWSSELWGLYNMEHAGIDINVKPVWDNYTVGSSEVIVAIVDAGVDTKHPDLSANCTERHYNYVAAGAVVPEDHGTHVAGTIAAVSNNGIGVCGIAGGDYASGKSGVKITSYQIFQGAAGGSSAAAIADAADNGALICQNSWGYNYDRDGDGKLSRAELEVAKTDKVLGPDQEAIDYFITYAGCTEAEIPTQKEDSPMKGGLVVFAAGNDNIDNAAPGNYEKVIAVGAVDSDGKKASFSNYGSWVDICAPGVGVLSTVPDGAYATMDGTSMACPHVSGVAALVLSYCGGPGFTADMLKEKILNGANKIKIPLSDNIGVFLDAYGAITYGDGVIPEPVEDLSVVGRGNSLVLSWTQTADSNGMPAYGALVIYGKDKNAVEAATPKSHSNCGVFTYEPNASVGEKVACLVGGLDFSTTYYLKMFTYTYSMTYSDATEVFPFQTTENHAPEIEINHDGEIIVKADQSLTVEFDISESDGHTYTVSYTSGSAADVLNKPIDGKYSISIIGKNAPEGEYTGKLTVTDQYGMSASIDVPYTIKDNSAPVLIKNIEDMFLNSRAEFQIDMAEYVTDPDGEQLMYEIVISNPQVLFVNAQKNLLYATPLKYGTTDVVVTASDARGEKVVFEFKVLVKDPAAPVSLYPNPVTDYVNVGTLEMASTSIRITSSTGKLMYEETMDVSGLEPARIDMSAFAPGIYSVAVSFDGNEYVQNIVKL